MKTDTEVVRALRAVLEGWLQDHGMTCKCVHCRRTRAALASTPAGQPGDEVKRLREENARFKEQRRSVESGLAMLEMGVCARTLAGDQKDWRTTRRALTICVERLQEVRALLVKDTEDSADED